jgi:small-conductance mechanosensitive channel
MAAITAILWKLIGYSLSWYQERGAPEGAVRQPNVFLPLLERVLRGLLVILAATIVLNNYGVNVTALLAVLGIGGLALSLAAQDTLSDMINGFLILLDQPFRVGDRIVIEGLDTWGDVVEVGTRTTRIRTLDNRLVIVPNSAIGKSQVVNYTYPDPSYRVQAEIGIAYGSDPDQVTQVIVEAVGGVEGVLAEKPVEVLLLEFGDSALKFRVRWWLDSYTDTRNVYDQVHRVMYKALDQAGIEMPFSTYDVNMKVSPEDVKMISSAWKANKD